MADPEIIKLGDPDPGIKPNTWPEAHRVWVVDKDRTHADGYLEYAPTPTPEPTPEPEPEREPITVTTGAAWADLNEYEIGNEVFANVAAYTGGNPSTTTYRYRWQTRATADDSWKNGSWTNYNDHAIEVSTTITEPGQLRFQCQARDTSTDPVEQINSFAAVKTINTPAALVVSTPVVTGEPYVGETLTCSEPTVSGGVGPYQLDYFWVDESNVIVWEATYMGNTATVIAYDLGKNMKCLVSVTDKGYAKGETVTVQSNSVGPIGQYTIGNVVYRVDEVPVAEDDAIPTMNGQEHIIDMVIDGTTTKAQYIFDLRSGAARLSPAGNTCIVINQTEYPGSINIQCNVQDNNTVEQVVGQRLLFVLRE